jgi:hypothetical protein
MKRIVILLAGVASLLASACFAFVLVMHLFDGAGLQRYLPFLSTTGVLIGWVHVMGLALASGLSFALGVYWCADGLVSRGSTENEDRP